MVLPSTVLQCVTLEKGMGGAGRVSKQGSSHDPSHPGSSLNRLEAEPEKPSAPENMM